MPRRPALATRERVWEAIDFIGGAWGWQPGDNYKPREWIVTTLDRGRVEGRQLLPERQPDAHGRFDPEYVERLEYAGDWLKVNGEAIYGPDPVTATSGRRALTSGSPAARTPKPSTPFV